MAIGLRLRHQRGTDVAAAAAAVLDDDRLAPLRLQLVADDSGKHIVGAAAGIRNEKFYRPRWEPVLPKRLVGPWRENHRQDEDEGEGGKPSDHGDLPSKDVQGCSRIQVTRMPRPHQTRSRAKGAGEGALPMGSPADRR